MYGYQKLIILFNVNRLFKDCQIVLIGSWQK